MKPENILCTYPDQAHPVKLCDLDLASKIREKEFSSGVSSVTTPELQSPVSKIHDDSVVAQSSRQVLFPGSCASCLNPVWLVSREGESLLLELTDPNRILTKVVTKREETNLWFD